MTLLEQLQSATEGSREIGDQVLLACGWKRHAGNAWCSPAGEWRNWKDRPDPSRNLQDVVSLAVVNGVNWLHPLFTAAVAYDFEQSSREVTPAVACLVICEAIIKAHESKETEAA